MLVGGDGQRVAFDDSDADGAHAIRLFDAQGKLVGLAFDGIQEAVASNWVFEPVMTRMISVDQRYMRWIMQEVMPAPQLLRELGVAPAK